MKTSRQNGTIGLVVAMLTILVLSACRSTQEDASFAKQAREILQSASTNINLRANGFEKQYFTISHVGSDLDPVVASLFLIRSEKQQSDNLLISSFLSSDDLHAREMAAETLLLLGARSDDSDLKDLLLSEELLVRKLALHVLWPEAFSLTDHEMVMLREHKNEVVRRIAFLAPGGRGF